MDNISRNINDIDTPAILIEARTLNSNIREMQKFANSHHVSLRPHTKTHKMPDIAEMQISLGANGVAVAKVSEAEIMLKSGIDNIQIANEIVGTRKIERLLELSKKAKVSCAVDSLQGASDISLICQKINSRLDVLVEVNTGLNRCGIASVDEILKLCQEVVKLRGIRLIGIMTHAGHAYSAKDVSEVQRIGEFEGSFMVEVAQKLSNIGINVGEISVGSTPTARYSGAVSGVTELRPGNYVFNDMTQVALGTVPIERCALSVLSTVISVPEKKRVVIDGGSKTFALDRGTHGSELIKGFGHIIGKSAQLVRLSEEHGIIEHDNESFSLGERVRVIPNHACTVVNLFDYAYLVDGTSVVKKMKIEARGMVN